MDFLTNAICARCNYEDSYYAAALNDVDFIIENCNKCGAEGQFFLKITELA
jgi:hypothetical protein